MPSCRAWRSSCYAQGNIWRKHRMIRSALWRMFTAAALSLCAAAAQAQNFPNKPITLMVGLAAGGITDVTARLYAEVVSKSIGQRVIVENRTGAGGAVAAANVQIASP